MITGSNKHIEFSRKVAAEGMVLLKNNNEALPLLKNAKISLFGKATIDYVKGGGGSSDVDSSYVRCLADGMKIKEKEGKISLFEDTISFYKKYVDEQYKLGFMPGMMKEATIPNELVSKARAFSDTAIISFSRYSGEGWDKRVSEDDDIKVDYKLWPSEIKQRELYKNVFNNNDFDLTKEEKALLDNIKSNFDKVIVVLNIGSVIDTNWSFDDDIDAVLISWQGGMEGGIATADVLCGDVNPSGHLSDTFASSLFAYPSVKDFHKSSDYVIYNEDIYVGYRYFNTFPDAINKVNYPFGFGLSYTNFKIDVVNITCNNVNIDFSIKITNIGNREGKDVIQLYYGAPNNVLGNPSRELISFYKTAELLPSESENITLSISIKDMKSYDDVGKIKEASWVLEKGIYHFYIGENVRDAIKIDYSYEVLDNTILETTGHKLYPASKIERLVSNGTKETVYSINKNEHICSLKRQDPCKLEAVFPEDKDYKMLPNDNQKSDINFEMIKNGEITLDEFVDALNINDKLNMLGGQVNEGVAITNGIGNNTKYNIPNIMTSDGPGGLRIKNTAKVKATSWPIATSLACTWNIKLVEEFGNCVAQEAKENNLGIWLSPACNIHRSPLCGRNFEYFSEDPYLTGKIASAIINGAQKEGVACTAKHFVANNKETNRKVSDSIVSERALREIYLKQFEIIVKESKPYLIMSSYNKINGIPASENKELLTDILRTEWGYKGVVTSDWWTLNEHYMEVKAGNDLKMPVGYPYRLKEAYEKGLLTDEEINLSVKRILSIILKTSIKK